MYNVKSLQNHKIWKFYERPLLRWEGIIDVDLKYMECEGMNWIQLAEDWVQCQALVDNIMNLGVSSIM